MTKSHLNDGGIEGPTLPPPTREASFVDNRGYKLFAAREFDLPTHIGAASSGAARGRIEVDQLDDVLGGRVPDAGLTAEHVPEGLPDMPKKWTTDQSSYMNGFAGEWSRFGRGLLVEVFSTLPMTEVPVTGGEPVGLWMLVEANVGKFLSSALSKRVFYGEEVHPYPDFKEATGHEPNQWEAKNVNAALAEKFRWAIYNHRSGAEVRTLFEENKRRREIGPGYCPGYYVIKETLDAAVKWEQEREALVTQYLRGIALWEGLREYCQVRGLLNANRSKVPL